MRRMVIARNELVEKLLARCGNGFVKIITGIRRCGKSFLLNNLFRERLSAEGVRPDHIIAVDLDDKRFLALRDPLKLDDYVRGKIKPKRGSNRTAHDTSFLSKL